MSDIVLSSAVRQNLLSLQSTADLLSQTQTRLATGNKVNTALDNPTNYFTAQSLNNRASDINNLLDGIGNGVQVLQAANTGITSLQKLVDTAKSIANQALQASSGYSTKSQVTSTAVPGATAADLLGGTASNAVATGTGAITSVDLTADGPTNASAAAGTAIAAVVPATNGTFTLDSSDFTTSTFGTGDTLTFDVAVDNNTAQHITISQADVAASGNSDDTIDSVTELAAAINHSGTLTGATVGVDTNGNLTITSATAGASSSVAVSNIVANDTSTDGTITDAGLIGNGTSTGGNATTGGIDASGGGLSFKVNGTLVSLSASGGTNGHYSAADIATAITGASVPNVTASANGGKLTLTSTATTKGTGDTLTVDNFTGTGFDASDLGYTSATESTTGSAATDFSFNVNGKTVTLAGGASYDGTAIASAINAQVGTSAKVNAAYTGGKLSITSTATAGATDAVTVDTFAGTGFDATDLGFASTTETDHGSDNAGGLAGLELKIASTDGGVASDITFGTGANQVSTLDQLNTALLANNLIANLSGDGKLTIQTTNDHASSNVGAVSGSAITTAGSPFSGATVSDPVSDANAQNSRASLIAQYNNVIQQIQTTAQDSSFNGVNLLNGDQLKLVFNETGKSTLNISGVTDDPVGLGLGNLSVGSDFLDNAGTNKVLDSLNNASNTLRSQASTLGSNLSIVQIRQDFSKNLINVLQTGASNLTLADTNEEAANSQALSTRQSIAVSALSLANQSQQSVLRLLQ